MFIILILVVITCPDANRDETSYYLFYSFWTIILQVIMFGPCSAEATRRRSVFKWLNMEVSSFLFTYAFIFAYIRLKIRIIFDLTIVLFKNINHFMIIHAYITSIAEWQLVADTPTVRLSFCFSIES